MTDYRVFEVGDVVHILPEEPDRETVEAMGVRWSDWPSDEYRDHAGETVTIREILTGSENDEYGRGYRMEGRHNLVWFGQDFEEFYEDGLTVEIDMEAFMKLLG